MRGSIITNTLVVLCLLVFACALQTTLWPVVTTSTQPHIWICFFTYISLYRDTKPALLLLVVSTFILKGFTLFPLSYLLLAVFVTHFILKQIKDRTFWKGPSYYLLCTFVCTLLFGFNLNLIENFAFGQAVNFSPSHWLLCSLLNLLFSIITYKLLRKIDQLTSMPLPAETGYNQYV